MKNINLKGNVKAVDISDLKTGIERTELGLRVSKMEQIQKTIQFLRSLSNLLRVHGAMYLSSCKIPFRLANDGIHQTLQFRMMASSFGSPELTDLMPHTIGQNRI